MTVRIDPDGVLAMSAATLVASGTATGVGEDLQAVLDAAATVEKEVGHPLASSLYRAGGPDRPRGR